MSVDDTIIAEIVEREGGYVDHPADRGGPTNYGITQATLAFWRGHPVTVSDVRALKPAEAAAIYRERYLNKPGLFLVVDDALRGLLLDCAVNHGPMNAVKFLQRALGVPDDGIMGPVTLDALHQKGARSIYLRCVAQRIRFYGAIITHDPSQAVFAKGWMARAAEFLETAPV